MLTKRFIILIKKFVIFIIDMKHEPQKYSQSTVDYTKDFSHLTADERKELYDSVVRKNPNPDPDNASKNLVL